MSATWYNTSGNPSRGNFRYAVIRSPGAFELSGWTIISPNHVNGGLFDDYRFRSAGRDGSDYLYHADANLADISNVCVRAPSTFRDLLRDANLRQELMPSGPVRTAGRVKTATRPALYVTGRARARSGRAGRPAWRGCRSPGRPPRAGGGDTAEPTNRSDGSNAAAGCGSCISARPRRAHAYPRPPGGLGHRLSTQRRPSRTLTATVTSHSDLVFSRALAATVSSVSARRRCS
jgi:hypothetical protein